AWTVATATRLVPLLIRVEDRLPQHSPYPALLAWPGTAYAACALLTVLAVATTPEEASGRRSDQPEPAAPGAKHPSRPRRSQPSAAGSPGRSGSALRVSSKAFS